MDNELVNRLVGVLKNHKQCILNLNGQIESLKQQIANLENVNRIQNRYLSTLLTFKAQEQRRNLPLYLQKAILGRLYQERTGKRLDWNHPRTYNEKMQWMKLYWNPDIKVRLTDKYLAREFVREKAGEKYLLNNLGGYGTPLRK